MQISPIGYQTLVQSCPRIEYIKINNYFELTDYHLKMVTEWKNLILKIIYISLFS